MDDEMTAEELQARIEAELDRLCPDWRERYEGATYKVTSFGGGQPQTERGD